MPTQLSETRPPGAWTDVFDQMQDALTATLAATPEPATLEDEAPGDIPAAVHQLDDQLTRLQASLDAAERKAAETDAWLRSEAEALQRWLDALHANKRKLAEWAARAV